jgi:porphobilinogen deaminase
MNKLRIATRSSSLALIQTQIFVEAVKKQKEDIDFEIVEIKSKGDIDKKSLSGNCRKQVFLPPR